MFLINYQLIQLVQINKYHQLRKFLYKWVSGSMVLLRNSVIPNSFPFFLLNLYIFIFYIFITQILIQVNFSIFNTKKFKQKKEFKKKIIYSFIFKQKKNHLLIYQLIDIFLFFSFSHYIHFFIYKQLQYINMIKSVLSFLTIVALATSICTNVSVGTLSYDFTSLAYITSSQQFRFNFCQSNITCTNNNNVRKTFIISINNDSCTALTPSTEPSVLNYTNIQNGISINYPPVRTPQGNYYTQVNIWCSLNNTFMKNLTSQNNLNTTIWLYSQSGCSFNISNQFWQNLINLQLVFAIILWCVGLYSMFFGYFLIKITIFIYGAITATGFSIIYFAQTFPNYQAQANVLNFMLILSGIFGIFYGFFLITIPKFGYFNIGVWWGAIISLILQNGILYLSNSLIPFYITLGVISLALGVVAIMSFKFFIIISTSMISGFLLVRPLGFFLSYYPNEFQFYRTNLSMPWQYYLYIISMLVLMAIGIIFQNWLFKKRGKKDKLYHLEEQGNFRQKLAKILQFKEFRDALSKGKQQYQFLKNLVINKDDSRSSEYSQQQEFEQEQRKRKQKKSVTTHRSEPNYLKNAKKNSDDDSIQIELVQMKPKPKSIVKSKK